jgi:TolB-like protein/Tfp pilus assembly protein PilF
LSLYSELKRRNVFKVTIAYIIAAWLTMQVGDIVLGNISAPGWVFQVLLLFLFLGFPFAVILAWAFELTPTGLKRENEAARSGPLVESVTPPETTTAEADRLKPGQIDNTIAVLPFVNMSSDSEQEYFSDGLSEELLNLLTKISELRVAARTSSFSYKDKDVKVAQIGEELNVAHVLEGSVRKSGNRVRITAQLIHVEDGYHLWSETFDRALDDVFAIQDEIAAEVVTQLKVTLVAAAPKVKETDPEAYNLFLQARHLARQGATQAFEQSIALFQQALAVAPNYVAAWAGLAAVYCDQTDRGLRPAREGYALARSSADKALAIDPEYAKAHARKGLITIINDHDLAAAAQHLERAMKLDPMDLDILADAAFLAGDLGRLDEAVALLEYVVAHDPVNPRSHRRLAVSYLTAGRQDDAIASFRTAMALSPGQLGVGQMMGIALLMKGEHEAALEAMEKEPGGGWRQIGLSMAYHALGRVNESDAMLEWAISTIEEVASYNIAFVLAFRGETDRAFEWLEKAVHYNDPGLSQITSAPMFANIHSDPRWLPFLEKLGKSPTQLAAIEFKVSLPE